VSLAKNEKLAYLINLFGTFSLSLSLLHFDVLLWHLKSKIIIMMPAGMGGLA